MLLIIIMMYLVVFFAEIRFLVKNLANPDRDEVKVLQAKLEQCRNQDNNPRSQV